MSQNQDQNLIRDIQAGNIGAFEILVKKYQKKLIFFAKRYVKEEMLAEDVAQETFIAVYKHLKAINVEKKFSTYLFEIAKNKSLDILRKRKREVQLKVDHASASMHDPEPDDGYVHRLLAKLQDKYRRVLEFYYLDDLSYAEISKKMHLPINTVRTHLSRAKKGLRKLWI